MGPATPLLAAAAALTSSNRTTRLEMRKRAGAVGVAAKVGTTGGGVFVFT